MHITENTEKEQNDRQVSEKHCFPFILGALKII